MVYLRYLSNGFLKTTVVFISAYMAEIFRHPLLMHLNEVMHEDYQSTALVHDISGINIFKPSTPATFEDKLIRNNNC